MNETGKIAKAIVRGIIKDLSDRRGLGQEWEQIDREIRREIVAKWEAIAAARIGARAERAGAL